MPERLVLRSTGDLVGAPVRRARTVLERTRGLLGTDPSAEGPLLLERTRQVHTFGMRYPLDVIFCDKDWNVVHVVRDMKPGRMTRWVLRARVVIELPSQNRVIEVSIGDALQVERY